MDSDFLTERAGLEQALRMLYERQRLSPAELDIPMSLPEIGIGSAVVLDRLGPAVLSGAASLGDASAMAHMDPPTPWISWATTMWNAALNQNLLHPATAPVAREIERKVIEWVAPYFGMTGGHMLPGSTLANVTALWAARECGGITNVVAGDSAHVSLAKAANLLGLKLHQVPTSHNGSILAEALPGDLRSSALVLTAGTTGAGAIDDLSLAGRAAWTHVDAAWAGPLRFSRAHASRLDGIEHADSVAISAHKLLFQPKESALILFRDTSRAHEAISFGGAYLAAPNVGILGSHGATAVPLLATLLAWGRKGIAERIDRCMEAAEGLALFIESEPRLRLLDWPATGVVVWQPVKVAATERFHSLLPRGSTSLMTLAGDRWCRNVAANPNVDVEALTKAITRGLDELAKRG